MQRKGERKQMRNVILLICLFFIYEVNGKTLTPAQYANNHPVQGAIKVKLVVHDTSISTATDPFAAKTNKYCETAVTRVYCHTKPCNVKWGSSAPTATANDFFIPAEAYQDFVCSPTTPYLSVIEHSASGEIYVIELE